nr:MAG TPA: hypothetical protein [Caudoviricetes sp.]
MLIKIPTLENSSAGYFLFFIFSVILRDKLFLHLL